jgi:hypothetical protein
MKNKGQFAAAENPRQAEAAKTNRLRALRLAKEAEDKATAAAEAASQPAKPSRARASALKRTAAAAR